MKKIIIFFLCLLISFPAPAKEDPGTFSMMLENDLFTNTDRHYTNGVRASWLSGEGKIPEWLDDAASNVPLFAIDGKKRYSFAAGQSMYTPEDIKVSTLQRGERPYAGWLYGSVGLVSDTGRRLDNLELSLGMVGPSSKGEEAQKFVHRIIDSPTPMGWDFQLKDEPGIILTYERKWRGMYQFSPFGFGMDVTPHLGGSIGNVFTHGEVGLMGRIGYDLPADYGPPRIRPSLPGSDFFVPTKHVGWYIFSGISGRAVARNIFLDGNTFRESHHVEKKNFVGDAQAGIAFTYGRARLAYTQIFRTTEFEGQDDPDTFGAITLSVNF